MWPSAIELLSEMWRGKRAFIGVLRGLRQRGYVTGDLFVWEGLSALVECDIVDERQRLVARASSTCMTLRGQLAEGRKLSPELT